MLSVQDRQAAGQRFSIMPYLGWWLVFEGGHLLAKRRTRAQAERLLGYLRDGVPGDADPMWDRLLADVTGGQGA